MGDVEAPLVTKAGTSQQNVQSPQDLTCMQKFGQLLKFFCISIIFGFFTGYIFWGNWILAILMIVIIIVLIIAAGTCGQKCLEEVKSWMIICCDVNRDGKLNYKDCQFFCSNIASYGGTVIIGYILGIVSIYLVI